MLALIRRTGTEIANRLGLLTNVEQLDEPIRQSLTSSTIEQGIAVGLLRRYKDQIYPSWLLRLSKCEIAQEDLVTFLPSDERRALLSDAFRHAARSSSIRSFPLLHAKHHSSHYFDCDSLLLSNSLGRRVVTDLMVNIIRLVRPNFVASMVSTSGDALIGAYPLCFSVSLDADVPAVLVIFRQGGTSVVKHPDVPLGGLTCMGIHDVITTGHSNVTLQSALVERHLSLEGVLTVFDRGEGGSEKLRRHGIPVVSILHLLSLRSYCLEIANDESSDPVLRQKAAHYLDATNRIQVVTHEFGSPTPQRVRVAFGLEVTPSLNMFDEHLHIKASYRDGLIANIEASVLRASSKGCQMILFPELTIPLRAVSLIEHLSKEQKIIIIGGTEYTTNNENLAVVAIDGVAYYQRKIVKSPYDRVDLNVGDTIHVFQDTGGGNFAVLVCADQFDYQLLDMLRGKIHLLLVVARTAAAGTTKLIAGGDAYRATAYVVVANDPSLGDSLVASPIRGSAKIDIVRAANAGELEVREVDLEGLAKRGPQFLQQIEFDPTKPEERQ